MTAFRPPSIISFDLGRQNYMLNKCFGFVVKVHTAEMFTDRIGTDHMY